MKLTLAWLEAAGIRALKTVAQTAIGLITVGAAMQDINWVMVGSVALVAGILSILTSLTGLPEVNTPTDGTLQIDTSDPTKDVYRLSLTEEIEDLASKKTITLTVDPNAKLTQITTPSSGT